MTITGDFLTAFKPSGTNIVMPVYLLLAALMAFIRSSLSDKFSV
jgi:hypothetical protein